MSLAKPILATTLKGLSLFMVTMGSINVVLGAKAILGDKTSILRTSAPAAHAFLDSQARFYGTAEAGLGLITWYASNDMVGRRSLLGILGAVTFVAGLSRVASGAQFGFDGATTGAMVVELVAPVAFYLLGA